MNPTSSPSGFPSLANRPGFIIGFALAGLLASFAVGLALPYGEDSIALINLCEVVICVLIFILGVRELAKKRDKARVSSASFTGD